MGGWLGGQCGGRVGDLVGVQDSELRTTEKIISKNELLGSTTSSN